MITNENFKLECRALLLKRLVQRLSDNSPYSSWIPNHKRERGHK